jgi:hypothetical protein
MLTGRDGVRFRGKTGSSLPTAKVTRLTRTGHIEPDHLWSAAIDQSALEVSASSLGLAKDLMSTIDQFSN